MTDANGWPEVHGAWFWFQRKDQTEGPEPHQCFFYDAWRYASAAKEIENRDEWTYLGPCHTPQEVAALVAAARREGMEAAAVYLDNRARDLRLRDAEDRGLPDSMGHSFEANAAEAWAASLRAIAKEIKP